MTEDQNIIGSSPRPLPTVPPRPNTGLRRRGFAVVSKKNDLPSMPLSDQEAGPSGRQLGKAPADQRSYSSNDSASVKQDKIDVLQHSSRAVSNKERVDLVKPFRSRITQPFRRADAESKPQSFKASMSQPMGLTSTEYVPEQMVSSKSQPLRQSGASTVKPFKSKISRPEMYQNDDEHIAEALKTTTISEERDEWTLPPLSFQDPINPTNVQDSIESFTAVDSKKQTKIANQPSGSTQRQHKLNNKYQPADAMANQTYLTDGSSGSWKALFGANPSNPPYRSPGIPGNLTMTVTEERDELIACLKSILNMTKTTQVHQHEVVASVVNLMDRCQAEARKTIQTQEIHNRDVYDAMIDMRKTVEDIEQRLKDAERETQRVKVGEREARNRLETQDQEKKDWMRARQDDARLLKERHERKIAENRDEYEKQLEELGVEHEKELAALRVENEEILVTLEDQDLRLMAEQKDEYEQQLAELIDEGVENHARQTALNQDLAALQAAILNRDLAIQDQQDTIRDLRTELEGAQHLEARLKRAKERGTHYKGIVLANYRQLQVTNDMMIARGSAIEELTEQVRRSGDHEASNILDELKRSESTITMEDEGKGEEELSETMAAAYRMALKDHEKGLRKRGIEQGKST